MSVKLTLLWQIHGGVGRGGAGPSAAQGRAGSPSKTRSINVRPCSASPCATGHLVCNGLHGLLVLVKVIVNEQLGATKLQHVGVPSRYALNSRAPLGLRQRLRGRSG